MNKGDLTVLVPGAKQRFVKALPKAEEIINSTEIVILTRDKYKEKRAAVFDSCGKPLNEYETSEGESVIGEKKSAVIVYAWNIRSAARFRYVLWHELGHVYSYSVSKELFREAENDADRNQVTLISSGLSVWAEFIAESIAYIVEDAEPADDPEMALLKLEGYLDAAVNSGSLHVYPLAFFYAMAINNPTICLWTRLHNRQVPGFNHCDDEIIPLVGNLLNVLGRQLQKDDFVRITPAKLKEIGKHVDILWDYCEYVGSVSYGLDRLLRQGR